MRLRERQRPIKDRFRQDAAAALVTLHAEGQLGEGVTCSIATGNALVRAGLHPATGGDGRSACSGDLLLQALVACAGVTMGSVAESLGVKVEGSVHAQGDLDWRGTLAIDKQAPVGFTSIRLRFDLVTTANERELETLLRLTERYCVVYQTLKSSPDVTASIARHDDASDY